MQINATNYVVINEIIGTIQCQYYVVIWGMTVNNCIIIPTTNQFRWLLRLLFLNLFAIYYVKVISHSICLKIMSNGLLVYCKIFHGLRYLVCVWPSLKVDNFSNFGNNGKKNISCAPKDLIFAEKRYHSNQG